MENQSGLSISGVGSTDVAARENEGTIVKLVDHVGEPLFYGPDDAKQPVTVLLAGKYSERYRGEVARQRDAMLKKRGKLTGEELARQVRLQIAACIIRWDGVFADETTPLPVTRDNVIKILDAAPWIQEQLEAELEDHERFFSGSSPS